MTKAEIISSILKKLDELTPFDGALVISANNDLSNPIKSYIEEFLPDACDRVLKAAPYKSLPLDAIPDSGIKANVNGVLPIELPDTFIRVGMVDFKSWERPVFNTITVDSPEYILQKNKYTRGGNSKPVVVLLQKSNKKYLECYTVTAGEENLPHELTYVSKKAPENMPDVFEPALTWLVASDVLKVLEKFKEAEVAFNSYTGAILNI